ncbi:MAG TPA: thiamine phosphate synthase [Opitutaceae bacterium]|nr:thiamine phosphate synthase [Opitutaceae bacterium]
MKLVVISPEHDDPREIAVLGALFAAGLERYHVRKPHWLAAQLETWLRTLPAEWRSRLVLHSHHELVARLGLGGHHWRDDGSAPRTPSANNGFTSRSCHDLATLRTALGHYDSVFFGPVFPSISKPGRGLSDNFPPKELSLLLNSHTTNQRRTTVLALGGISAARLPQVHAFGFDGVAVLGAVWQADDPVAAFCEMITACAGEARWGQPAAARPAVAPYPQPNHAA